MPSAPAPPSLLPPGSSRLAGLMRDLSSGLAQQMFFWGRDVVHPSGNLLLAQEMKKSASTGLQGTSCYAREWQGGTIELHGACVGWYPRAAGQHGFIFIRPLGKSFTWLGAGPPVPGEWPCELLAPPDFDRLRLACLPFVDWWLESERWIDGEHGPAYRAGIFRKFKHLPRSKPWLPPDAAMRWLESFRSDPGKTGRAKCGRRRESSGQIGGIRQPIQSSRLRAERGRSHFAA